MQYEETAVTITDSTIVYLTNSIELGARYDENGDRTTGTIENNYNKGTDNDFNDLQEFLDWLNNN